MYQIIPLQDTPERAHILAEIVTKICGFDTAFSDYQAICEERCTETKTIPEFCEVCRLRLGVVALAFQQGITWEVWDDDKVVGIIRLSDIKLGQDAKGHYIFFDRKLNGKTEVIQALINWAFTDHAGWPALKRLTVQIPDFAFALAKHAHKKLGFTGPFDYTIKGSKIKVEGVKKNAVTWRGHNRDLLSLGLLNPNHK